VSGAKPQKPLALTLGEPAGIGPDIVIEAWLNRTTAGLPPFIFVGDADVLRRRAKLLGRTVAVKPTTPAEAVVAFPEALPFLADQPRVSSAPGIISPDASRAVIGSIRRAAELVHGGQASAVVTNPIQKKALNAVGFPFPGHTEYLAALAAELFGTSGDPVMMLASAELRVVPATIHMPLAKVPAALTQELIVNTGIIVERDLRSRFGISRPRLAVSGLNPHAGEEGMLGDEEDRIVRPAVEALRAAGVDASGPYPGDTLFHAEARVGYDAALCMYHDQALIPFKTLAFDTGVNVTLGLPFVRTSPDHGTALSIAGSGRARATSLIEALRLADAMAQREAVN
jgi:4-hydroxythreonine-4-phosphate dehydrogenase